MSLLSDIVKTGAVGAFAPAAGLAYAASGGRYGVDPTSGFSATNVIRTQASKLRGGARGGSTAPQNQPNNQPQFGGSAGGGSSAQAAQQAADRNNLLATLASQEQQIGGQLGRLDPTFAVGVQNLYNAFQNSVNKLDQQKALARRDYDVGTQDTIQDYQGARNQVASQTRARMNSLRQLLGQAGAGNSSASQIAAPYAATREGTQQLAPVQTTYARNRRALDTGWQDTERNYDSSIQDLRRQEFQQEQALRQSVEQQRADLLQKLNDIGVQRGAASGQDVGGILAQQQGRQDLINGLLNNLVNLGNQYNSPVLSVGDLRYAAPELGQYNIGEAGAIETQAPGAGDTDPLLLPILAGRRDEQQQLIPVA